MPSSMTSDGGRTLQGEARTLLGSTVADRLTDEIIIAHERNGSYNEKFGTRDTRRRHCITYHWQLTMKL